MKHKFSRILCAALYCAPLVVAAQNNEKLLPCNSIIRKERLCSKKKPILLPLPHYGLSYRKLKPKALSRHILVKYWKPNTCWPVPPMK